LPQIDVSFPAFATAGGKKLMETVSVTAQHMPLLVEVRNMEMFPSSVSVVEGMYAVLKDVSLLKVPLPVVDQIPEFEPPDITPVKLTNIDPVQWNWSGPAFTSGDGVIEIIIESVIPQAFVAAREMVNMPVAISELLGIYVAFRSLSLGENTPVPEVLHIPVVVLPKTSPLS
jgi:hypothetical protein